MTDADKGKIVFLAFSNPGLKLEDDGQEMMACTFCRNKTYTMVYDKLSGFPMVRCAACQREMGRMGWTHDEDEPKDNP